MDNSNRQEVAHALVRAASRLFSTQGGGKDGVARSGDTVRTGACATLGLILFLVPALLFAPACKRKAKVQVQQTEEDTGQLASVIHTADPNAAAQLLKGFHAIEQNAWRWTMANFAVVLRPPKNAPQRGATLSLKFSVPDPVIQRLKTVSLSVKIGAIALAPETYTQAGEFTFTREIDGKALGGDAVNIEFTLDKAIPPGEVDQRELGIVVSSVGLEAK